MINGWLSLDRSKDFKTLADLFFFKKYLFMDFFLCELNKLLFFVFFIKKIQLNFIIFTILKWK